MGATVADVNISLARIGPRPRFAIKEQYLSATAPRPTNIKILPKQPPLGSFLSLLSSHFISIYQSAIILNLTYEMGVCLSVTFALSRLESAKILLQVSLRVGMDQCFYYHSFIYSDFHLFRIRTIAGHSWISLTRDRKKQHKVKEVISSSGSIQADYDDDNLKIKSEYFFISLSK